MDNKEFLVSLYEELPLPFLISDKEGYIIYANKALCKDFPSLKTSGSLRLFFPAEALDTMLSCSKVKVFEPVGMNISVTVIPCSDSFCIQFLKSEENDLRDKMMSSLLLPVPHIFRSSISEMLLSVSSIYAIGEEKEDEKLMETAKALNLNCYRILRGNNLITSYCRELTASENKGEKLDLSSVLRTTAQASRIAANELGIDINIDIEDEVVPVMAKESSLVEALIALIDNAIKYSSSKKAVTIKLSVKDKNAVITIADKGIGIPGDVLPYIFEPYYSYDRDAEPLSGVGLGLTLARLIALKWGGNITISSKDYEGTTAIMTLPVLKTEKSVEFNSKITLTRLLRDRFSTLNVMLSDTGNVPLP